MKDNTILCFSVQTQNEKIVWEHGLNWLFYALMLTTKLYNNTFRSAVDQNLSKPKSRPVKAICAPTLLSSVIIIRFFLNNFSGLNRLLLKTA